MDSARLRRFEIARAWFARVRPPRIAVTQRREAALGVCVLRGPAGLAQVREHWERLYAALTPRRFMHLYAWHAASLRALAGEPERVYCFVVLEGARPVALLPVQAVRETVCGLSVRALTPVAHPHLPLADILLDPHVAPHDVFHALARAFAALRLHWDVLILRAVPAGGGAERLARAADWGVCALHRHCDYLPPARARRARPRLTKAMARLTQQGRVQWRYACGGDALAQAFNAFLEVEASGWKGARGARSAIKLDPRLTEFYRRLLHDAPEGTCEIDLLMLDERPIAAHFGMSVDDAHYALKIGYDERYARSGPGRLVFDQVWRRVGGAGKTLNMVTDAAWHAEWRPQRLPVFHCFVCNRSARGFAVYALLRARAALAHARRVLKVF